MQGPPPMSSPPLAPPIKKQRGGEAAAQDRAAQLQALRTGFQNRPRMGPPPARRTIPSVGFNPRGAAANGTAARGTSAPSASVINPNNPPPTTTHDMNNNNNKAPPPAIPARQPNNFARQSDIFPQAPKAETPAVARRLDVAFTHEEPQLVADDSQPPPQVEEESSEAPPAKPPSTSSGNDKSKNHKGVTFAETVPSSPPRQSGSSSGTTAGAATPMVSSPEPVVSPAPPARTPGPAGRTPFPGKAVPTTTAATPHPSSKTAGHTPHPHKASAASSRREMLAQMHDVADTPPSVKTTKTTSLGADISYPQESVELRMQKKLTEETQKNAQLHKKVAELEDQLTQQAKAVTFSSPVATGLGSPLSASRRPLDQLTPPRRRAPATPHPKYDQPATAIDRVFWEQATEEVPYKFEAENPLDDDDDEYGVSALFIVRRPYDYAGMDRDLWFVAGEANSKMYARDATVDKVESIEVAVQIQADDSVLMLYDEADVRHQNAVDGVWNKYGNYFERGMALGTVAYIDGDANEREYSLDKLVEQAMEVRKHYCASLRGMALGLQRRAQQDPPPVTPMTDGPPPMSSPPGVATPQGPPPETPLAETKPRDAPAPPVPEGAAPPPQLVAAHHEPQSDVFSVLIGLILSLVYGLLKLPFLALYTLATWILVAVLTSCLYLCLLHTMEWTGVAPPLYYYHNPAGIM